MILQVSSSGWAVLVALTEFLQVSVDVPVLARPFHVYGASVWTAGLIPLCSTLSLVPPKDETGPIPMAEAWVSREQIELSQAS